jgi:hypothetical protein
MSIATLSKDIYHIRKRILLKIYEKGVESVLTTNHRLYKKTKLKNYYWNKETGIRSFLMEKEKLSKEKQDKVMKEILQFQSQLRTLQLVTHEPIKKPWCHTCHCDKQPISFYDLLDDYCRFLMRRRYRGFKFDYTGAVNLNVYTHAFPENPTASFLGEICCVWLHGIGRSSKEDEK